MDLSKISDEDLKKEFEKRSLGKHEDKNDKDKGKDKEKETRACKSKEKRDDSGLSLDDASALISSVFGDDFANNLVSQSIYSNV